MRVLCDITKGRFYRAIWLNAVWWKLTKQFGFQTCHTDSSSALDSHRRLWPISVWTWPRCPSGFCRCHCERPHSHRWCSGWSSRRTGKQWLWPHCQGSGSLHCTSTEEINTQRHNVFYFHLRLAKLRQYWFSYLVCSVVNMNIFHVSWQLFSCFTLTSPTLGKVSMVITVSSPVWFCSCPFRIRADVYVVNPIPEAQNTNLKHKQSLSFFRKVKSKSADKKPAVKSITVLCRSPII